MIALIGKSMFHFSEKIFNVTTVLGIIVTLLRSLEMQHYTFELPSALYRVLVLAKMSEGKCCNRKVLGR